MAPWTPCHLLGIYPCPPPPPDTTSADWHIFAQRVDKQWQTLQLINWRLDPTGNDADRKAGSLPTKYIHPRDPISLEKLPVFASCHRKSSWVKRSKKGRAGGIIKVGFDLGDCMEAWASCYGRLEKRRRGLAEGFIKKGGAIGRIKGPHHDRIFKGG